MLEQAARGATPSRCLFQHRLRLANTYKHV